MKLKIPKFKFETGEYNSFNDICGIFYVDETLQENGNGKEESPFNSLQYAIDFCPETKKIIYVINLKNTSSVNVNNNCRILRIKK